MINEPKTFDLRNTDSSPIRYDISSGKTVSDLTSGILNDIEFDKSLIEEIVIERLTVSVAMLRYAIGGDYAPFPKNFQVNALYSSNGKENSMPVGITELDSAELYSLRISDNYTVVYNDKTVLKLERERGWYIESNNDAISLEWLYDYHGKRELYLNETDIAPMKLTSGFTLEKYTDSLGILTGPKKFDLTSSAIEPSGFYRPNKISDELADFLGHPKGTAMPLTDVTREIHAYIRENNLENKDEQRKIIPDKKLLELLKLNDGVELTYFNLPSYLKPHFEPVDFNCPTVMYDGNKYYYVMLYTDDYRTNDLLFTHIRRWRVTH